MIRRPPRSTQSRSSAASDVYKRQLLNREAYWRCAAACAILIVRLVDRPAPAREVRGGKEVVATPARCGIEPIGVLHVVFGRIARLTGRQVRCEGRVRAKGPTR